MGRWFTSKQHAYYIKMMGIYIPRDLLSWLPLDGPGSELLCIIFCIWLINARFMGWRGCGCNAGLEARLRFMLVSRHQCRREEGAYTALGMDSVVVIISGAVVWAMSSPGGIVREFSNSAWIPLSAPAAHH